MDLTPYDRGAYLLLPHTERSNMALRRELDNAAKQMGVPLLHEPSPAPADQHARERIAAYEDRMRRDGIIPAGQAAPPAKRMDNATFLRDISKIAAGSLFKKAA